MESLVHSLDPADLCAAFKVSDYPSGSEIAVIGVPVLACPLSPHYASC